MTKLKIMKVTASVAASLGLMAGVVGIAGASASNNGTGTDSNNKISSHVSSDKKVKNDSKFHVSNDNSQDAYSGNAEVKHNTTGGSATTGDTTNGNKVKVDATVDNGGGSGGSGVQAANMGSGGDAENSDTGTNSTNTISSKVSVKSDVKNTTDVKVTNNNTQSASSGNAKVSGNTTGGNATSGDASNNNTVKITANVTN